MHIFTNLQDFLFTPLQDFLLAFLQEVEKSSAYNRERECPKRRAMFLRARGRYFDSTSFITNAIRAMFLRTRWRPLEIINTVSFTLLRSQFWYHRPSNIARDEQHLLQSKMFGKHCCETLCTVFKDDFIFVYQTLSFLLLEQCNQLSLADEIGCAPVPASQI